ncbi:SDR family oxidoreductase [Salinicoccus carnicancri]|uniref:SDR family oxidoreductase n=1 Tax=Salinicoccus carnicancri TaxID=558170 RepID=UPI0002D2EB54|nr:SDR family oxidoreductase [Salinicoccus carnicancri]
MKRVLVAGATGYLGRYVVKELKRQGFHIKALVRSPQKLNRAGEFSDPVIGRDVDEVVEGDITKPDTLKHVCDDVDYVFSSVGITRKSNGLTFNDVDYKGNLNLLKEAEYSDVAKFMYIHVYANDDWKDPGPLIEAKNRFVKVLRTSNVDHIIIRPTGYFSDLTQFMKMARKGRVYLIGNGRASMNPIHGEDLAQFCVKSLSEVNSTLDVGGPETLTYRQIAQTAFDVLGEEEHITHIPAGLISSVSMVMKVISRHNYGILRFFINVMTHDVTAPMYGKHKVREIFHHIS